jgi:hypothetical protein
VTTPTTVACEAWVAKDDVTARLDPDRYLGKAMLTEYEGPRVKLKWLDNRDTDAIHEQHEDVRDLIWQFDDAIREATK